MGALYFEENGKRIQVREIEGLSGNGTIIAKINVQIQEKDALELERELSRKLGRTVGPYVEKLLCLDDGQ